MDSPSSIGLEKARGGIKSAPGLKFSDHVTSNFKVRGFPPFRQEKGEKMGHGTGTKASGQRPGPSKT
jgi:hypothetical protein